MKGNLRSIRIKDNSATFVPHVALLTGAKLKPGVSLMGPKEAILYSRPLADENYEYFNNVNARYTPS